MPTLIVIGGGIAGLSTAMLLARDGHHVTVLERDPAPPPHPEDAWSTWERRGVNQFRLPHMFMARFRELLELELSDVGAALEDAGALRFNRVLEMPESISGGRRRGDERFDQLTGRRPMVEAVLARAADAEPGVEIRRGIGVRGLVVERPSNGRPHVAGVLTDRGSLPADLVVDAGGRRSMLGEWLTAAGAPAPVEERADSGYVYYGRHFRSADGAMPPMLGPALQHYESLSLLTLPADNGYWSVGITTSAKDTALRCAKDAEVWGRIVDRYPLVAHWIDAEPVTGIDVIAKIEDRVRRFDPATAPTGIVAVGDSAACTNPSIGRGTSIAFLHAVCLRDVLRDVGTGDELPRRWTAASAERVEPLVTDTLSFDRHRRAQIEAEINGVDYETDDPAWNLGRALMAAAPHDPDLLRGAMSVAGLLARGIEVIGQPGIMDAIVRVGDVPPLPGPSRAELVEIVEQMREVA